MTHTRIALLLALFAVTAGARAQEEEPPPFEPDGASGDWSLVFEPMAWFVAPEGRFRLPGAPTSGRSTLRARDANVDEPNLSPAGQFHWLRDPWRVSVSGFATSATGTSVQSAGGQIGTVTYSRGDTLRTDLDIWSLETDVAYRAWSWESRESSDFEVSVEPFAGARAYGVDMTVNGPDASSSTDELLWELLGGARLSLDLNDGYAVEVEASGGWGGSGDGLGLSHDEAVSYDISVMGVWRPIRDVGVLVGYRQLSVELEAGEGEDEFMFNGSVAGFFGGVQIRF